MRARNPKNPLSPPSSGALARAFAVNASSYVRAAFILFRCASSHDPAKCGAAAALHGVRCVQCAGSRASHAWRLARRRGRGAFSVGCSSVRRALRRCAPARAPSDALRRLCSQGTSCASRATGTAREHCVRMRRACGAFAAPHTRSRRPARPHTLYCVGGDCRIVWRILSSRCARIV